MGDLLRNTRRALLAGRRRMWKPDPLDGTFTAGMANRTAPGPFAAAPIVQGDWDGTGTPDALSFSRGALLGNQTQYFYADFDPYQATIVLWLRPEWAGNDGIEHNIVYASANYRVFKTAGNLLQVTAGGQSVTVSTAAWTAGTLYHVVASWNGKSKIDGTNYGRVSVNNSHTYGMTTQPTASAPGATIGIGATTTPTLAVDGIVEGLTIYRRVLYDGTYGVDVGNGNELTQIYAAGAGIDPTLVSGSFDITFCMPTNSTAGAFTSGVGNAWTHPFASNIPDVWGAWDGGLPGTPYAVEFNGSTTVINCGSGATLDDIPSGGQITVGAWVRADATPDGFGGFIVSKRGNTTPGWSIAMTPTGTWGGYLDCATTDAQSTLASGSLPIDGKWHYVTFFYDDTAAKTIYLAVDGKWAVSYSVQTAGVGAYQSDAAISLLIGDWVAGGDSNWDGGIAWLAIWSDDHHTAGTNFIPPRTAPTPGGNLVECWHMDEGTGATAAAQVTSPANDGTITSGTWSSIWEVEGTPVVPQSHTFDGSATEVACGSAADIDDVPSGGTITAEAWVRFDPLRTDYTIIMGKASDQNTNGWCIKAGTTNVYGQVRLATTSVFPVSTAIAGGKDNVWHHLALYYDDATKTGRLAVDGIWGSAAVGAGAYQSDAAGNFQLGVVAGSGIRLLGALSFVRFSDNDRYGGATGTRFVPPARSNPPAVDGNTLRQFNFTDGAGTTLTDATATANGTITQGTGVWRNTPDMTLDEPGARIFNNGYNIGSDGASDGITIIESVTAETDYVNRLVVSLGQDGRAWPEVYLYDNVGAAQIGATYALPRCHDVHTGANNSATLINANGAFTQQLVGWVGYNITDGCTGTITAVSGDKTTCTFGGGLSGGTDNDFDTNDVYQLRPPSNRNYSRYPFATESIFVFRTPAGCTSVDLKIRNAAGEGVMSVHQFEVLESLLDNGDHEALTGANPDIITGWTNNGLDAGDTESSAGSGGIIHAGAEALEWNPGAILGEGQYETITTTIGKFFALAGWTYGDGATGFRIGVVDAARALLQYSAAAYTITTATGAYWDHTMSVWRALNANPRPQIEANTIAGDGFTDDFYAYELSDVSLTVTPASAANSAEGTGIRVDGLDTLTQVVPVGRIGANWGDVRFDWTPRHGDTESVLFNAVPNVVTIYDDANNWIQLRWNAADTLRLRFNANGAGENNSDWATGGSFFTPGTTYEFRVRWTGGAMRLYVDGVLRITVTAATGFNWTAPTNVWFGSSESGIAQVDAVYSQAT